MSDNLDADAVKNAVSNALGSAIGGRMVTRWVMAYETIDVNGMRSCSTSSNDLMIWDALGLLRMATVFGEHALLNPDE